MVFLDFCFNLVTIFLLMLL